MRTKVVGVSFINDDGSNRANIISKMDENSKKLIKIKTQFNKLIEK